MRNVRKGTRSCWECRRRKIRCTFTDSSDPVCNGCHRRSIKCVGQELPEDDVSSISRMPTGARLSRVEALLENLTQRMETGSSNGAVVSDGPSRPFSSRSELPDLEMGMQADEQLRTSPSSDTFKPQQASSNGISWPLHSPIGGEDLSRALRAAWPDQRDLDLILKVPVPVSRLYHGVIFTSYSEFLQTPLPRAVDLLQLPTGNPHPILLARRLLLLTTFLQSVPPSSAPALKDLSVGYMELMTSAFSAASRLVTNNDELTESLEGIECIMMESMYHNNAGNLRRAWLAIRKAIGIAQIMGLHGVSATITRGIKSTNAIKMVDPQTTRERMDPSRVWFRLVSTERYLSLMLGLPETVTDEDTFASVEELEGCIGMESMERMMVAASGLILKRNRVRVTIQYTEDDELAMTLKIDRILQQAAASMPPKWWSIPCTVSDSLVSGEAGLEYDEERREAMATIRLMNQMVHYHLLIRLYLLYLLRPPSNHQCDNQKTTIIHASRELLTRYVAFRLSPSFHAYTSSVSDCVPSPPYCRGVDFLAFVASTVLCLAGIDAQRQSDRVHQSSMFACPLINPYQRHSDRGLMEHTLDIMERMARSNNDVVATGVARLLRPLLVIEANVAHGVKYKYTTDRDQEKKGPAFERPDGDAGDLDIHIPHCGVILIERCSHTQGTDSEAYEPLAGIVTPDNVSTADQVGWDSATVQGSDMNLWYTAEPQAAEAFETLEDWALQGVDLALFEEISHGMAGEDETA